MQTATARPAAQKPRRRYRVERQFSSQRGACARSAACPQRRISPLQRIKERGGRLMTRTKRNAPSRAIWRAALYTRLSREDGDKPESDSIANQWALLGSFASQQLDLEVAGNYSDDGFTGTNFQRPDFQRMITDIGDGKVNCVIVKDLSRFGRDYINAGQYLERWFPEHGGPVLSGQRPHRQ